MSIYSIFFASPRNRKNTLIVGGIAAVMLLAGSKFIFSDNQQSSIPTTIVKRGDVIIKITESGELRAQDQVTISAPTDKQILWLKPEGTWVEEGDTLIIFESEKYVISKGEAESNLRIAESQLVRAMSDLEAQRAKEQAARRKYESLLQLSKEGFAVASEVEQARLNFIELKSKTRSFEAAVNAARANVQRAERQLNQQERKLRMGVVQAPRAGLVVYAPVGNAEDGRKIEVGMIPFEGMDLMYLPDVSSMMVDTQISEVDLFRVRVGMPVKIKLDAYPDAIFDGEVANIADLAKRKISRITGKPTGAKVFDVTVKVLGKDKRLKPGLTATVDIIVNEYKNTVYVPLEAIFIDELDRTIVYVKNENGSIEQRMIDIVESNDRVAVIKEGLEEGEVLLLARPENL
ncbi:MAG: efflux RND transporter periplasmic adaptor subunit [candidate division KSB1 bacterium]|nr:efflux RND transporter periplasmic adaptor subunit [candidate division KSB1 bacterium]